jgi:seryl-tRNA synthetase
MHDIKSIRDDPDAFDAGLARRGLSPQSRALLEIDARRRAAQTERDALLARRSEASKQIGGAKNKQQDAGELIAEVGRLKDKIAALEAEEKAAAVALDAVLATLPNIPAADVPDGADAATNREVRRWSEPRKFEFRPREHYELGESLGQMDFQRAAKLSGARFTILTGALARLERALAQFMLDLHTREYGYVEISPPLLVRDKTMYGVGQLPKFADDLFRSTSDYWLIPTAEVPLTAFVADEIVDAARLPIRLTAHTACFRAEAGAAGKDTRGMLRQHQFYKVELVSIVHPDKSDDELERMTQCAEDVLKRLELPYRTVVLSTGDMGFNARKTYDIEVWLPGQNAYREISSCSNCGDFHARRMNARFRKAGEKGAHFVHTLNGSGLAVGRTLIAVMENCQRADGSIEVPQALRPYMGGLEAVVANV